MKPTACRDVPQLEDWQFKPDNFDDCYCPGLYLQCVDMAQREAIMRALGWRPESERNVSLVETIRQIREAGGFGLTADDIEELRNRD
jgi:hypothetical protein